MQMTQKAAGFLRLRAGFDPLEEPNSPEDPKEAGVINGDNGEPASSDDWCETCDCGSLEAAEMVAPGAAEHELREALLINCTSDLKAETAA